MNQSRFDEVIEGVADIAESIKCSLNDHERLLDAYADRDVPLAIAITRSIVNSGYQAIESAH